MYLRWITLALPAICLLAGCRSGGNAELLERELRRLEDQIYELEDQVQDYQLKLDSCRRENAALRRAPAAAAPPRDDEYGLPPGIEGPAAPPRVDLGQPYDEPPESFAPPRGSTSPPDARDVDPFAPLGHAPPPRDSSARPRFVEPPPEMPPSENAAAPDGWSYRTGPPRTTPVSDRGLEPPPPPAMAGDTVERIALNRLLSGGYNRDGLPGDEGLQLVIEPLRADGQVLAEPGDVTIVVVDPAQAGRAREVARWEFTAIEAADRFQQRVFGQGIFFELPWPGEPPRHRDLDVHVRYAAADGRVLEAHRPIAIELMPLDKLPVWADTAPRRSDAPLASAPDAPRATASTTTPATAPRPSAADAPPAPRDGQSDAAAHTATRRPEWRPYR